MTTRNILVIIMLIIENAVNPVEGGCRDDLVHIQGSCYKNFPKPLNWNASKSACEKLGSKLVVINSQAEQDALGSTIPVAQLTWIGLSRDPKNYSRWLWVDGTRPNYTHWATNEPNNLASNESVYICTLREGCGNGMTGNVIKLALRL
ncbi:hypothetical protein OS493_034640 [Desmophyllum pertusum]|uniref:C-type lectin domain-containing protein n=1 Tax=Desmophyllum pertusum TaxID=174260 RepID=A0A9W9ZM02_9CNID|nr:hypothetical protein OS493_034640 [Desmophyllum pertusum]